MKVYILLTLPFLHICIGLGKKLVEVLMNGGLQKLCLK
jgi:hypothetical protein